MPNDIWLALALAGAAAAGPGASSTRPVPADTGLTGILSEEAFKALHELKQSAPPPLRGELIDLDGARAYLSLPEGAEPPLPGLVVIHEWWGLNDHIKHWADRLAADGYAALAVDLYGGRIASDRDGAMRLMRSVDEAEAVATLRLAHGFLVEDPRVRAPRTGAIGWCFGGGWSLQLALAEPELDAAVIYYGRLVTDPERLEAIEAPLLGVFANRDQGIPPDVVDAFDEALDKAGVKHRILRYDADHAFANPSGARYDEQAAGKAWAEVREFLEHELGR